MRLRPILSLAASCLLLASSQAQAFWYHHPTCDPDSVVSDVVTIEDPSFGAYTVRKTIDVFSDQNCGNPVVSPGSFTYVYTLEVLDGSTLGVEGFAAEIQGSSSVIEAGFIGGGPPEVGEPVSTVVSEDSVRWFFVDGAAGAALAPGQTSAPLYVVSPFQPGTGETTVFGEFALAAPSPCVTPSLLPEPSPCSSFFWKLRALDWFWVKKYFPGDQFDQVKARAVELSGGFFADEGELVAALFQYGFLDVEKKARRQVAALLLNIAAGELFPANTKCRLFPGTELDQDGDGTADGTVDGALTEIITKIDSGDASMQLEAFFLALKINLGKIVIGAGSFH